MRCPVCDGDIKLERPLQHVTHGGVGLDMRRFSNGTDPNKHAVHICDGCAYVFESTNDACNEAVLSYVRSVAYRALLEGQAPSDTPPSLRYRMLASLRTAAGESPAELAWIYMRGSWMARDEIQMEIEQDLLRLALDSFRRAVSDATVTRDEAANYRYMVAEIHRRLGEFDKARMFLDAIEEQESLANAAKQQRHLIDRMDTQPRELRRL